MYTGIQFTSKILFFVLNDFLVHGEIIILIYPHNFKSIALIGSALCWL